MVKKRSKKGVKNGVKNRRFYENRFVPGFYSGPDFLKKRHVKVPYTANYFRFSTLFRPPSECKSASFRQKTVEKP